MKVRKVEFVRSAQRRRDHPESGPPEVAFLGRSNVGKSSLLNRLVGRRGLARVSRTPGRTQLVNYFLVNDGLYLVDLPGYGYAKVPRAVRESWEAMMRGYLSRPGRIALAVQLVDARRPATALDRSAAAWLAAQEHPSVVVLTKFDKLRASERPRALRRAVEDLGAPAETPRLGFSATTGLGLRELWRHIDAAVARHRPDGAEGRGRP